MNLTIQGLSCRPCPARLLPQARIRTNAGPGWCLIVVLLFASTDLFGARPPEPMAIHGSNRRLELSLPREPIPPLAGTRYRLRVESATDLRSWLPAGELQSGDTGVPSMTLDVASPHRFFRLAPEIELGSAAADGADVWGYNRVFAEELRTVGYQTPDEFAARHQPGVEFLERIEFDPRLALFWQGFAADPSLLNQGKKYGDAGWRSWDFRLDPAELDLFLRNGFVVSPRLGSSSASNTIPRGTGLYIPRSTFADLFYRVFNDDLPVFVSADAALHAWHYSFTRLLSEIEQTYLAQSLGGLLDSMAEGLTRVPGGVRTGPLAIHLDDADYFVAVARSLLARAPVPTVLKPDPNVARTLEAISAARLVSEFPMFGGRRDFDFSQFTPRGHYTRSADLSGYFKAFMWTARANFRIVDPDDPIQSRRELGDAVVLSLLVRENAATAWADVDSVLRLLMGRTDALGFAQLDPLLRAAGIGTLGSLAGGLDLDGLQARLLSGTLGLQSIPSDVHFTPMGIDRAQLPRVFSLTGQRFVPDGWAMSQVTFDRVPWFEDIPGATFSRKVLRRVPAVPDVAYAVLGNRPAGWYLAEQMTTRRVPDNFRDGYPYAHHLSALARTFDRLEPGAWTDSIYSRWLWALRALSPAQVDSRLPQAMRTRAWAMHSLNTQLASYSQLKHDTLLYGKQPYAANVLCEYPAGFVEPVPEFWRRMGDLARATAGGLAAASPPTGLLQVPNGPIQPRVSREAQHKARIAFCQEFAATMDKLLALASKELRQEPHSSADLDFIRGLMNAQTPLGYGGATYDGWYPKLFYEDFTQSGLYSIDMNGSNIAEPNVVDLFTAPPDRVDPTGGVLHAATGNVDLLLISVDSGPDRMVYAGPVLSYYEFLEPGPTLKRLTDEEWATRLGTGRPTRPTRPAWTAGHIAPAP